MKEAAFYAPNDLFSFLRFISKFFRSNSFLLVMFSEIIKVLKRRLNMNESNENKGTAPNGQSNNTHQCENTEMVLKAMDIYLNEYIHRDSHMWSQNFKFFYAALICTIFPYVGNHFDLKMINQMEHATVVFPIVGIILALVFLYNSFGLTKRFRAVSSTYIRLATKELPKELRLESIDKVPKTKARQIIHTYSIPVLMFLGLISIAILVIILELI